MSSCPAKIGMLARVWRIGTLRRLAGRSMALRPQQRARGRRRLL